MRIRELIGISGGIWIQEAVWDSYLMQKDYNYRNTFVRWFDHEKGFCEFIEEDNKTELVEQVFRFQIFTYNMKHHLNNTIAALNTWL